MLLLAQAAQPVAALGVHGVALVQHQLALDVQESVLSASRAIRQMLLKQSMHSNSPCIPTPSEIEQRRGNSHLAERSWCAHNETEGRFTIRTQ